MKKISIALILFFALLIAFASVAIAQMTEKGWKKTVTLQSGEVILDMSGEWESTTEFYGVFWFIEPVQGRTKITQEGTSFTGVKQIASKWRPKGAETIKGELDKDGFKAVYSHIGSAAMDGSFEWAECKWEISEKGNRIDLDCGERAKSTLTRK
jgi:hypothetical protein